MRTRTYLVCDDKRKTTTNYINTHFRHIKSIYRIAIITMPMADTGEIDEEPESPADPR